MERLTLAFTRCLLGTASAICWVVGRILGPADTWEDHDDYEYKPTDQAYPD